MRAQSRKALMRISKTISILFFASFVFIVSTVIAGENSTDKLISVETTTSGEDALFVGMLKPTKGKAGLPKGLSEETFSATAEYEDDTREPASVQKAPAKHWSASTSDGFEYKIRIKQQVSAVWVMKREDHYDLIFASNSGSRVNLSIPAEQFYALKNAASDLRAPASDMNKCKDNFVQLEMVEAKSRKLIATCLSTKSAQAEQLRQFGSALTAFVR